MGIGEDIALFKGTVSNFEGQNEMEEKGKNV
jgi:hypothetical protein